MDFTDKPTTILQHFSYLRTNAVNGRRNFAILKLVIENEELIPEDKDRIEKHNSQFMNNILADSLSSKAFWYASRHRSFFLSSVL